MRHPKRVSSTFSIAVAVAALATALAASGAQAAARHFDGTVLAKSSTAKTFDLRTGSGARITFEVNARTKFERIAGGFGGLRKGMAIEVDANKAAGDWVAVQVEPRGGGGGGGDNGGGHGGHDDGPNHT